MFVTFFRFCFPAAAAPKQQELTRVGAGAEQEAARARRQQHVGQEEQRERELQLPAVHKHLPGVFPEHRGLQGHVQHNKQAASGTERGQSI